MWYYVVLKMPSCFKLVLLHCYVQLFTLHTDVLLKINVCSSHEKYKISAYPTEMGVFAEYHLLTGGSTGLGHITVREQGSRTCTLAAPSVSISMQIKFQLLRQSNISKLWQLLPRCKTISIHLSRDHVTVNVNNHVIVGSKTNKASLHPRRKKTSSHTKVKSKS